MNNKFIDEIEFTKNPKLHRPKDKKGMPRKRRNLLTKLLRLFYFILILFVIYKFSIYAFECYIGFGRGTGERVPIAEFIEDFKEQSKE